MGPSASGATPRSATATPAKPSTESSSPMASRKYRIYHIPTTSAHCSVWKQIAGIVTFGRFRLYYVRWTSYQIWRSTPTPMAVEAAAP